MAPTLVIGLGGAGLRTVRRLHERLLDSLGPGADVSELPSLLTVDTDRETLEGTAPSVLVTANAALIDAAYRAPGRFHAHWLDREILRRQRFTEEGTAGSRMLARFLLLLPENRAALAERLSAWLADPGEGAQMAPRRVFVVAGAAGGTGGGQVTDLGYLLRALAERAGVELDARAMLFVPPPSDDAPAANAFATLT